MSRPTRERKPVQGDAEEWSSDNEEEFEELEASDEPPKIEPYTVLGLEKTASADEIKQAYRKAALKHHPDKSPEHLKSEAHIKFQEVAFAYAVLSDPARRARYDKTGSTSESISADDFNWTSFYSEQFKDIITPDAIETFSKAYKGSDGEKDDVVAAYTDGKGNWAHIYEVVMLSDPLEDEDRFRGYIDEAIEAGDVESYTAYTKESKSVKTARMKAAKGEAKEAMEYAKELGVHGKLFGEKKGKKGKKENSEDSLAALIQSRNASRGDFFSHLEAKYGAPEKKSKKGKGPKRGSEEIEDEPSEEAFQAAAARLKNAKAGGDGERKAKRTKR